MSDFEHDPISCLYPDGEDFGQRNTELQPRWEGSRINCAVLSYIGGKFGEHFGGMRQWTGADPAGLPDEAWRARCLHIHF